MATMLLLLLPLLLVSFVSCEMIFQPGVTVEKVTPLNKDTFRSAIGDSANPLWLLKFFAPWCGHCKKLAPILDEVAPQIQGKMAIGTIDCTVEKKLCSEFNVRGYPTLKFSVDGEIHDYPGGRKASEIIYFAEKMSSNPVQIFVSVKEAMDTAENDTEDGVAFVAYHPALNGETIEQKLQSTLLTQIYSQVARKQKAFGSFYLLEATADPSSLGQSGPCICRIEANVAPKCYQKIEDIELNDLLAFVREQSVPTVSQLAGHNFHKVGRSGRPLVIGVVDSDNSGQVSTVKLELARYATTGPEHIRDKYYYGWFDGKIFQKFLHQFDVSPDDMPQVFLLDVPKRIFWQNSTYKLNIHDFLAAVEDGTIPSKNSGKQGLAGAWERFVSAMVAYRPWSVIFLVLFICIVVVAILSFVLPGVEELRPPYPKPPASITPNDAPQVETKDEEPKKEK